MTSSSNTNDVDYFDFINSLMMAKSEDEPDYSGRRMTANNCDNNQEHLKNIYLENIQIFKMLLIYLFVTIIVIIITVCLARKYENEIFTIFPLLYVCFIGLNCS